MNRLKDDRRLFLGFCCLLMLIPLELIIKFDPTLAIAAIIGVVGGTNAWEKVKKGEQDAT